MTGEYETRHREDESTFLEVKNRDLKETIQRHLEKVKTDFERRDWFEIEYFFFADRVVTTCVLGKKRIVSYSEDVNVSKNYYPKDLGKVSKDEE